MNIALFASPGIWAPLQSLLRRLTPAAQPRPMVKLSPAGNAHADTIHLSAACEHRKGHASTRPRLLQHRPLRIVRILEAGQTPAQVGRMVISGRMADVCAELDRLAASEAALH